MSTADDTTASTKALLRQQFRAQRQALLPVAQPAIETQALRHVPGLLSPGQLLGLYWPLPGEVDLRTLRTLLPENGGLVSWEGARSSRRGWACCWFRPWPATLPEFGSVMAAAGTTGCGRIRPGLGCRR